MLSSARPTVTSTLSNAGFRDPPLEIQVLFIITNYRDAYADLMVNDTELDRS